jgi:hypothetical protein
MTSWLPAVGDALPALAVDISTRLIVAGAIASRDYQDVHHDKAAAQALGTPDIFMNILTTNGLVGRYLTDWAGEGARLKKVNVRLGVPNFPGDCLRLNGKVVAVDAATGDVEVAITGRNKLGDHVTGSATVAFAAAQVAS